MRDILSDLGDMLSHPDPVRRAQIQMKKPLPKRFSMPRQASARAEGGYTIELDGRTLKTPARDTLLLPTRALADLVAGEWQAQLVEINPMRCR